MNWISANNRKPDRYVGSLSEFVLVWDKTYLCQIATYSWNDKKWYTPTETRLKNVTHWAEIKPPEDE